MKIKKITSILIAFAMCLTSISALAYEPWVEDGAISITSVTLADGSELAQITGGETINLKAQVKAGKDASIGQTAQLLVVSYKNGFVNSAVPGEKITVTETAAPITATFTVPSDADELRVFVLDGRETRRPLAQMGVVGADAEVTDIKIDGESIDGFSKNTTQYNVELSAAYIGTPEIVVNTSDILAKTEITRSEELPAQSWSEAISVTKNGERANYTINFTQEAPAITNAVVYQWKSNVATDLTEQEVTPEETDGFVLTEIVEPTYNGGLTAADYDAGGVSAKPDNYVKLDLSSINDNMIYDIPDEFVGGTLFQLKNIRANTSLRVYSSYSMKGKGVISQISDKVPDTYASYSFDINRSATVYAYNAPDTSSTSVNETGFTSEGFTKDPSLILKRYNFKSTSLSSLSLSSHWYKKHVVVDANSTETVRVPVGAFPVYVIVKFD